MHYEYRSACHINKKLFSLQLMNGPKKLESYITLGKKGLPWTNTLAYRAHLSYEENNAL